MEWIVAEPRGIVVGDYLQNRQHIGKKIQGKGRRERGEKTKPQAMTAPCIQTARLWDDYLEQQPPKTRAGIGCKGGKDGFTAVIDGVATQEEKKLRRG